MSLLSLLSPKSSRSAALAATGVGLALMAGAAVFLARVQGFQRLGQPGVRLEVRSVLDETGTVVASNAVALPLNLPGYRATNMPIGQVELGWLPKDTTFGRTLYEAADGGQILMSAVLMGADRTSIHKPEYCLLGSGHQIEGEMVTSIPMRDPVRYDLPVLKMITTREYKMRDGSTTRHRGMYVYWFVADGRLSANHNQRMLSMVREMVTTGVLQRWAYISCYVEGEIGQEEMLFARVSELVAAAVPRFQLATGTPVRLAGDL